MNQIMGAIRQFNAIDLVFIILFARIIYISYRTGFIAEFFKLFGTVLAIYLGAHYFTIITDSIRNRYGIGENSTNIPLDFMDFISFVILAIIGYAIGFLLREAFSRLVKMEAIPALHRWGGIVLSIARSLLLMGIITYALSISSITYLYDRTSESYLGSRFWNLVPNTYSRIWYGFTSKFMVGEKFNKAVSEVQERH